MDQTISRPGRRWRLVLAVLFGGMLLAAEPITKQVAPDIAMPILGRAVYGSTGNEVGRLVDVLVDAAGLPQAAVLDVGGFLGVGNRVIAVHWAALHFDPSNKDHPIIVDMPAAEIAAAPQYTDTTAPAEVVMPHAQPPAKLAPVAVPMPSPPPDSMPPPAAHPPTPAHAAAPSPPTSSQATSTPPTPAPPASSPPGSSPPAAASPSPASSAPAAVPPAAAVAQPAPEKPADASPKK